MHEIDYEALSAWSTLARTIARRVVRLYSESASG